MLHELGNLVEHAEWKKYVGMTTLECVKFIVLNNPKILGAEIRGYRYVPDQASGDKDGDCSLMLKRDELLSDSGVFGTFIRTVVEQGGDYNVSIGSRVYLRGGFRAHIPMLNLNAKKSPANLALVIETFRQRVVPEYGGGFLIETGSSYHFLGQCLLSEQEWHKFNYLALSLAVVYPFDRDGVIPNTFGWSNRIVDSKYIGWSGLRGSSGLRISTNGSKTFEPKVVAVV